jgi:hypothetical protein
MESQKAVELCGKILEIQSLMAAYSTDGRKPEQPSLYKKLYDEVYLDLEEAKYTNPNQHKSLEVFYAFLKMQDFPTYASRRAYIQEIYGDILLELKRIQRHIPTSKNWTKANEVLNDELSPIRTQWLKAKNFIYAPSPDFENSIKESINSIESCLMILLDEPNNSLGKIIKNANLDSDIERLINQVYGIASNKSFVRHGGVGNSGVGKEEAEFFLDFSSSAIIYIAAKNKVKKA